MAAVQGQPLYASCGNADEAVENCIKAIASGDRDALSCLYLETRAAVFGLALSILKNRQDAEDVLQDVYLKIWQTASGYEPLGKPMAWILTITRNFALMYIRRENRTVAVSPEDWQEMFADVLTADTSDALVLGSVLELLTDDEREIVILHAVAGLKHRECADLLDMRLSTVLSKYSRALGKLRRELEEVW